MKSARKAGVVRIPRAMCHAVANVAQDSWNRNTPNAAERSKRKNCFHGIMSEGSVRVDSGWIIDKPTSLGTRIDVLRIDSDVLGRTVKWRKRSGRKESAEGARAAPTGPPERSIQARWFPGQNSASGVRSGATSPPSPGVGAASASARRGDPETEIRTVKEVGSPPRTQPRDPIATRPHPPSSIPPAATGTVAARGRCPLPPARAPSLRPRGTCAGWLSCA